jgi:hypothetical protein
MFEAAHSKADDDDQEFSPGPMAGHVGLLKAAVTIMGVMLVVGTIVLIAGIIWKASQLPADSGSSAGGPAGAFEALDIVVPAGSVVGSVVIGGDRMAVTVEGAESEIIIVDLRRGEIVGRVRLTPGPAGETASSP